ncbi:spore coat protein [Paenibacillus mesophilus]|uniref:sugar phosphate nucleotidyltransferase n=1 Tax=Paenibacillus mesophilus TaxID=2582849 RepID=UPI00110F4DB2|nr:sugar phosphate nucleotidyltransferase [Paenibacillus mesophilus]TMV53058.1 spore coat protein [Paenibacillus mesophilus]
MKGVILAGGTGTRLAPLTKVVNKHLLPTGKYPMIHHAVRKLAQAGIEDIMIVLGKQSAGLFLDYLGSGKLWGVRLTYRIQEEAGGIAQGLSLAEGFIGAGEKMVVLLGDNLFEDDLKPFAERFKRQEQGAMVMLKEVDDLNRYGVPVFLQDHIIFIEEKPSTPKSDYCVTGVYMYDSAVFDVIRKIRPSQRGELEITDVNNVYAMNGGLQYGLLTGWWTDAGTFESLREAGERLSNADGGER